MKYDSWEDIYKARQANSKSNSLSAAQYLKEIMLSIWLFVVGNMKKLRSPHPLPFEIYTDAIKLGVKVLLIGVLVVWLARSVDSLTGLHYLTPNHDHQYLPLSGRSFDNKPQFPESSTVLKPRFFNDTTFIVDYPLQAKYCRLDFELKKGRSLLVDSVIVIGIVLPPAKTQGGQTVSFQATNWGGAVGNVMYRVSKLSDASSYPLPSGMYGAPLMVLDGAPVFIQEGWPLKAKASQRPLIGVNLILNTPSQRVQGFYRFRFIVVRN